MTPRLAISGLTRRFGDLAVLDGVTLDVAPGTFVSLLGPSGSGKSTILKLLTGALTPDAGTIAFDGRPLLEAGRPFAFMPQRDALMPWRTIIDNVAVGLEIAGLSRKAARQQVAPFFEPFGLSGFERHFPAQLSGGMRQRAALMRTIVQDKPMLLLDEPFGALDALTRVGMQRWLETMWGRHAWTALLITHDVREAVLLSDRIYVLSARPARIVHQIDIDLPRPRAVGPDVAAIEARLLDHLLTQHRD
ncbi:ABC-type nitrate/sulfonate/bicarbonate transport system, ATPase component [Devosia enhydra]|uniref:ABC-type nitrate/sulfonate/bicarbonate transport system, ATPase component n=1 Tax=Devosia enhydra TaxID=665118 RepID=A0A1K2I4U2_9HYPH|nr:ABC transporter ATP-binding protein [Devosia enhydra]SFZ86748.1 ABC-type nitrate/sulfonate/bicarbonate transport system, ATPase component [Devosia enhydra]